MNTVKTSKVNTDNTKSAKTNEQTGAVQLLKMILYALSGFLFSRSLLLSTISPLGCAFAGACPRKGILFYFGMMVLGTITGTAENKLRYLAAITVIVGVRWTLSAFKKLSGNHLFNCLLVLASMLGTGLALGWSQLGQALGTVEMASESLLGAGICYIFRRSITFIETVSKRRDAELGAANGSFLIVSLCLLFGCANTITYLGISPFMSLMMTAIMVCAYRFGMQGGAVAAIAASVSICLSSPDMIALGFGLAVAGFVAGIMSGGGKIACTAGFGISLCIYYFLCKAQLQGITQLDGMRLLAESAIAIVIFIIIPESILLRLDRLVVNDSIINNSNKNTSTAIKLFSQANALSDTASEINSTVRESNFSDINLMQTVGHRVCMNCRLFGECCGKNGALMDSLYKNGDRNAPSLILDMCMDKERMKTEISQILEQKRYREELYKRAESMRRVLSGSLITSSEMLRSTALDMICDSKNDKILSQKLQKALHKNGIRPIKVMVEKDSSRRLKVTVELSEKCKVEAERLRRIISDVTGKGFQAVRISSVPEHHYGARHISSHIALSPTEDITVNNRLSEQAVVRVAVAYENFNYSIKTAVAQKCRNNAQVCGDVCSYFERGKQFVMSICDGMGAGNRAAMTGMLVSEMLHRTLSSGIECKTALNIISSAVAVKSGEENLCTVDIAGIDMNTAQLSLIKAGGAPTFIKSQDGVKSFNKTGLPIGILKEVSLEKESISLSRGDVVLMVSDGVLGADNDWIEEELNRFDGVDLQTLADDILERATMERGNSQEDDMSVFVGLVA